MQKKLVILLLTLIATPLLAGVYGILHDQLTYTLCHEYYTKFKFIQFFGTKGDVHEMHFNNERAWVAGVGFLATWWTGIIIGLGNGLVGLIHKSPQAMQRYVIRATVITITVAFITGLIGLAYGKFYLANQGVDWWLPDNLINQGAFIMVGSMHNFSYLGGLLGLIAGIVYQVAMKLNAKLDTTL